MWKDKTIILLRCMIPRSRLAVTALTLAIAAAVVLSIAVELPPALPLIVAVAACAAWAGAVVARALKAMSRASSRMSPAGAYTKLLAQFPEDRAGLSADTLGDVPRHQPMTYGLVLSAEAIRFARSPSEGGRRRIGNAVRFLLENADLDGDGRPGWGLPDPWDAFGDGSVNPANHPYTITTAIVMQGFLDALLLGSSLPEMERDRVLGLCADVGRRWCRDVWTSDERGGFFWYSPAAVDAYFVPNVSAFLCGVLSRLLAEHGDVFDADERGFIRKRVNEAAAAIVSQALWRSGAPFWRYIVDPNSPESRPNDLVHHGYIVWGMELYRSYCGDVSLPWSTGEAVRSADLFCKNGVIHRWPQDGRYARRERAVLWDAGMFLAIHAKWSDAPVAVRHLNTIIDEYGPLPKLRGEPHGSRDEPFLGRHGAHVLWAMAMTAFRSAPQTAR